jgi:translation initiation factor 3 subunit I
LIASSADHRCVLWDVQTGKKITEFGFETPVRFVQFAEGDKKFLAVTDASYGNTPAIHIFNLSKDLMENNNYDDKGKKHIPAQKIMQPDKITTAMWGPLNKTIVCGCVDGSVKLYDANTGACLGQVKEHRGPVTKISLSDNKLLMITASQDNTAKLFHTTTLEVIKTYKSTEPVNTAVISPNRLHVILGGGTDAREVTTTLGKSTYFDSRFFHMVFEEEIGRIRGHFGPIHILAYSPDGLGFASGGEDGYVRLHRFDKSYLGIDDGVNAVISSV